MLGLPVWKALLGKLGYGLSCVLAGAVLVTSGVSYYATKAVNSLGTSPNLSGGPSTGPMNILIMGLESRTYWDGTSINHHIATILHTGTATSNNGGNAANTLILLHIFASGKKAVGFSIPRDSYVPMVGTLGFKSPSPNKIDNAYGFAMAQQMANDMTAHPHWSYAQRSLDGNYAGQNAEIQTVEALTGVHIDKFVELNLVGFYEMAKVFGGVEVCVNPWPGGNSPSGYIGPNGNLRDPVVYYPNTGWQGSGSVVRPGIQHLTPEQTLAFVRNRHNLPGGDAARTLRQQAVIDYVVNHLKTGGILSDVGKLNALLSSAKQYVQFPQGWNLVEFGGEISGLTSSNIKLTTLPTTGSQTAPNGVGAVSTVDIPAIQRIVQQAFAAPPDGISTPAPASGGGGRGGTAPTAGGTTRAPAKTAAPLPPASSVTVDVINNGAPAGTAHDVLAALVAKGYKRGTTGNPAAGTPAQSLTTVTYGTGAAARAAVIARYFGPSITVSASSSVPAGHVLVTLGVATLGVPASLGGPTATASATTLATTSSSPSGSASSTSPAAGSSAGNPTALTPAEKEWAKEAKAKYGIPCVY